MNIVTQFPVNLNLNFANPHTEAARKEALSREAVSQAAENEHPPGESATGSENEKTTKRGLTIALTYDFSKPEQVKNTHRQDTELTDPNLAEQSGQDATEDQENRGKEFTSQEQSNPSNENSSQSEQNSEAQAREEKALTELKARDQEVRTHEQAHANIGGQYAGAPQYEFERGSDGKNYAVEGEVQIDVAKVAGDPQATIQKMEQVKRAALAPAEPSSADRKVANEASQKATEARAELLKEQSSESSVTQPAQIENSGPVTNAESLQPAQNITQNNSVAGVFNQTSEPSTNQNNTDNQLNTLVNAEPVPQFEPKQTLAQTESLNIAQRDQTINARALKIQRFYHQSYHPSEIQFTRYA